MHYPLKIEEVVWIIWLACIVLILPAPSCCIHVGVACLLTLEACVLQCLIQEGLEVGVSWVWEATSVHAVWHKLIRIELCLGSTNVGVLLGVGVMASLLRLMMSRMVMILLLKLLLLGLLLLSCPVVRVVTLLLLHILKVHTLLLVDIDVVMLP